MTHSIVFRRRAWWRVKLTTGDQLLLILTKVPYGLVVNQITTVSNLFLKLIVSDILLIGFTLLCIRSYNCITVFF